jgi:hypothetical protein
MRDDECEHVVAVVRKLCARHAKQEAAAKT